uniref:Uncharacterized protein n=1 Tax=Anopheles farauti TaxID=69004 RepID=A0A182QB55_9DIPT
MSKWNKSQGVVVPLESLLKERRKENCPAPRRSAGLVGRWGITSFTSIRSRSYVAEYNNIDLKDPTGLELGAGVDSSENVVNLLGSNTSEPVRPRKFFKSRNTIPPPPPLPVDHLAGHSPYAGNAMPMGYNMLGPGSMSGATTTTTTPPQQHFYQPLSAAAATPQFSPTGPQSANVGHLPGHLGNDAMAYALHLQQQQHQQQQHQQQLLHTAPLVKEKKGPGRKRKKTTVEAGDPASSTIRKLPASKPPKKEKKEKRPKKAKKEPMVVSGGGTEQEQPKRNSSRIRNRVVNYNEDEDSNDYDRSVADRRTKLNNVHQHPVIGTPDYGMPPGVEEPSFEKQPQQQQLHHDPYVTTAYHATIAVHRQVSSSSSPAGGGYHSGGEGRYGTGKPNTVATPLPSPSEHRPILLRISKLAHV